MTCGARAFGVGQLGDRLDERGKCHAFRLAAPVPPKAGCSAAPICRSPVASTTLYVGQVVYEADAQSNFTILSSSGRTTDICGQLS